MPQDDLQKIASILSPAKEILIFPAKGLSIISQPFQQLSDDMEKTKLQACLYGLKQINQKLKKVQSNQNIKEIKDNLISLKRNSVKRLQTSLFPSLLDQSQRQKILSKQASIRSSLTQNYASHSQLTSSKLLKNSFFLKQRLNQTVMNSKINHSLNSSKNSVISKTGDFHITLKSNLEKSNSSKKDFLLNKPVKLHPKIKKHLYETAQGKALAKQNRYFTNNSASIDEKEVNKIGIYQSMNRYRKQLLTNQMKNMSPKVQKKQLQFVKVCKQNELFLTNPKLMEKSQLDQFIKGQFVINEAKPKHYFQTIHTEEIQNKIYQENQSFLNNQCQIHPQQSPEVTEDHIPQLQMKESPYDYKKYELIYLEIKNYNIVKNHDYLRFKLSHIQIWEEIESLLRQIIKFAKQEKINSWKFKANTILDYWDGKKLSIKDLERILQINRKKKGKNAIQSVISILCAKRKMQAIIRLRQKRLSCLKWVCDRMIGIRSIRRETEYQIKKAYQLHQRLLEGEYVWDTQIYISSFSENAFVRNTTQYMESFENMFTHIWKESSKHLILVIPTINSEILQAYQERLKIKRSVTLICPEVHDLFPANLSLAGCLLFSYDALNKIKKLIEGKNAVIIPGKFSSSKYELLISEFLNTPLMTSLKPSKDIQFQKEIFQSAKISVLPFIAIRPSTTIDEIINFFAKLIFSHKQINNWIFKINGEFSGRGLATFCTKSSKVLRSILSSCKDTIKPLEDYLKTNLKLKLKINFENSLFMFGDYLEKLSEKGGIIEQQKDQIDSYEVSFFVQNKITSHLISCFKCFSVNHSNKAYIYEQVPNTQLSSVIWKLKSILETREYLGYVSVNLSTCGEEVYGMQIKPYLTHLASVEPFIKSIESKRQLKLNLSNQDNQKIQNNLISSTLRNDFATNRMQPKIENAINLRQDNTLTDQSHLFSMINQSVTELQSYRPDFSEFTYLFVPNIILTDVPIPKKAEFIQSIVLECFSRRKFDILENNLVLYLSNGLSLSLLVVGKDMKKIKKTVIEVMQFLSQKSGVLKIYCGKSQARDVFQFGDIIKAVTKIKA